MNPGPRVLHITSTTGGGLGRYVFELVKAVQQSGCCVDFIGPAEYEFTEGVRSEVKGQVLTPAYILARNRGFKSGLLLWPFLAARAAKAMTPRASVAHLNSPCIFALVPWFINRLRRMGYRTVYTVHDPIPHAWMGRTSPNHPRFWVLASAYRAADILVVHNVDGRDLLVRRFNVPAAKIEVIPHGAFHLSEACVPYNPQPEFAALLFGSLRANKGIDLAIRAVQDLRKEGVPVRLIIAGACDSREVNRLHWEQCKALIAGNGDGIEVIERFLAEDELPDLLSRSHLMLMPYTEFFSQSGVASLALSNGRALVATDVGGLAEIVANEDATIRIAQPTVEAVKGALRIAVAEGHESLRLRGVAGRRFTEANYGWTAIGERYRLLYESLILS